MMKMKLSNSSTLEMSCEMNEYNPYPRKCHDCELPARYRWEDYEENDASTRIRYFCVLHFTIRAIKLADYPGIRAMVAEAIAQRN